MNYSKDEFPDSTRQLTMLNNSIISLTFSPTGFSLDRSDPTPVSKRQNTRGFTFFRFLRDCYAWFSLALNSLVNIRTILTRRFYVQKLNCLTVFSEQPHAQDVKEQVPRRDSLLYSVFSRNTYNGKNNVYTPIYPSTKD